MIIDTEHNRNLQILFGKKVEWVNSGFSTASENMAADERRVQELTTNNTVLPMFRVYGWKPWAVSLGYHQKQDIISSDKCAEKGLDIVRRVTGGRAVLHANELTYSVVTFANHPQEQYRIIHELLFNALNQLSNNTLNFAAAHTDLIPSKSKNGICFTSNAKYELQSNGKKVVGSAQRIFGNVLLQHGSIILDASHEMIIDLFEGAEEKEKQQAKELLQRKSTSLSSLKGMTVTWDECANAIHTSLIS